MKATFIVPLLASALLLGSCGRSGNDSERLVILHTNDTHSQIMPGNDGLGGVMRRKAIIDSVRGAEKNVLLVDAGDAVQGTLYFYLYGGKVEEEMMNILGVDVQILGNHEFDNGIDSLAAMLGNSNAEKISTNYDLSDTPLKGMFSPYTIKEYGGKKIGIIGINLDPTGMIAKGNYDGLEFLPIVATANLTAEKLKKEEGVDAVIALSHIGYNPAGLIGDSVLATNSHDIDIIIGGHSHDVIDPKTENGARRSRLTNLDGEEVLVVQTGKSGRNIGRIEINLDSLGLGGRPQYELIKVDGRYDGYNDPVLEATLKPYTEGVDSLMHEWIGTVPHDLSNSGPELLNYFTDFIFNEGSKLAKDGKIDLAIANKGSLRTDIPVGKFSKGQIINLEPFKNFITVVNVKGSDLASVFEVMAYTKGNGVSKNVSAKYGQKDGKPYATDILIDGKPIDPDKNYLVATIDYLANGGDYMTGLSRGTRVATSTTPVYQDLLEYIVAGEKDGRHIGGDDTPRWTPVAE